MYTVDNSNPIVTIIRNEKDEKIAIMTDFASDAEILRIAELFAAAPALVEALHRIGAKLVGKYGYSEMEGLLNAEWREIYHQLDQALALAAGKVSK